MSSDTITDTTSANSTEIRPFRIDIPQAELDYDWRRHEQKMNAYPQFITEIDGVDVHFLHIRSSRPDALPLILTHGWPGTFYEYLPVIEELTEPPAGEQAFHLVIPSMPGFGFSGPTREAGWDIARVAAVHVAQVFSYPSGDPAEFEGFGPDEYRRLAFMQRFEKEHSGFNKIQSTRPLTLAHALADSPVGQLAWVLDPIRGFGDHPPEMDKALDADFALTVASLHWLSGNSGTDAPDLLVADLREFFGTHR